MDRQLHNRKLRSLGFLAAVFVVTLCPHNLDNCFVRWLHVIFREHKAVFLCLVLACLYSPAVVMVIPTPQPGHNCQPDTCHKPYRTQILTVCQPNNPQSTVCSKPNNAPHLKPSILQMSTEAGGWWWRYLLMLIKFRLNFVCVTLRTLCPAHGNLVFG